MYVVCVVCVPVVVDSGQWTVDTDTAQSPPWSTTLDSSFFGAGWSRRATDTARAALIGGKRGPEAHGIYRDCVVVCHKYTTRHLAKLHVMLQKEYARRSNDA
jgi:hypothetical protein